MFLNLLKVKPDYVLHGDDWTQGIQKKIRDDVVKTLKEWDGKSLIYHIRKVFHQQN